MEARHKKKKTLWLGAPIGLLLNAVTICISIYLSQGEFSITGPTLIQDCRSLVFM